MKKPPIKTYPLRQLTLEQAIQYQFRLVDIIRKHFNGNELLMAGDYGHRRTEQKYEGVRVYRHPTYTEKVEKVIAEFFGAKEGILVWGAGTGGIRSIFMGALNPGDQVVVDDTLVFTTTVVTMNKMGLNVVRVDMDNLNELKKVINEKTRAVHIEHANGFKKYRLGKVINAIRSTKYDPIIMTDENYVAMRVEKIGVQLEADLSTFSLYKLLGPEGIGIVLGGTDRGAKVIEQIRINQKSSAGEIVQGPEAMDSLKSLVYVPVMFAIHKNVVDEVCGRLNNGEVDGVDWAVVTNSAYRCICIKLKEPIAKKIYEVVWKYGSYARTIGVESRHELIGRISTASVGSVPSLRDIPEDYYLHMAVFRAGADTMIDILRGAIKEAKLSNDS